MFIHVHSINYHNNSDRNQKWQSFRTSVYKLLMKKNASIMFSSFSTNIFLKICCNIQITKLPFLYQETACVHKNVLNQVILLGLSCVLKKKTR